MSKIYNPNATFQKIPDAVRTTGLSSYALRKGCRDGSIPCYKSGRVYWIDIPALLAQMRKQEQRGQ